MLRFCRGLKSREDYADEGDVDGKALTKSNQLELNLYPASMAQNLSGSFVPGEGSSSICIVLLRYPL